MKRITIERYDTPTAGYAGCIEGETDEGQQWIMFLDPAGTPEVFWPERDPEGGAHGKAIALTYEQVRREVDIRMAKMRDILGSGSPQDIVKRLREALEAAEAYARGEGKNPEGYGKVAKIVEAKVFGREVTPEKPSL